MKKKINISVNDKIIFNSGNYAGLTGIVTRINWESKDKRAIHGFLHEIDLSNGEKGFIEKSEHWQIQNKIFNK